MDEERFEEDSRAESDFDPRLIGTPEHPSHQVFTLANTITILRLILTLVFLWMFISQKPRVLALAIYAIAASTDWLDGQIARRTQTVSWFGKILDPMVDRALLLTGIIGLVVRNELPLWIAVLLILRDVYLAVGANIVHSYRERPIDVIYTGKAATASLLFGFCGLFLQWPLMQPWNLLSSPYLPLLNHQSAPLGMLFVYLGVVLSLIAAALYTCKGYQISRAELERERLVLAKIKKPASMGETSQKAQHE